MLKHLILSVSLVALALTSNAAWAAPGDARWTTFLGANIGSSPAVSSVSGHIYLGSADRHVYSLTSTGVVNWRYDAGSAIGATPALNDAQNALFIGTMGGLVIGLNASNLTELWRYNTGSSVYSSPAVTPDGMVVVGADNGRIYALNSSTGALIWTFNAGSPVAVSPAVGSDGLVYVGTRNGVLHALRTAGNTVTSAWSTTLTGGVSSASVTDIRLYVGTFGNQLYAFDLQLEGPAVLRWSLPLPGRVTSNPVLSRDGALYVTTYDDGSLHAVNAATGALQWTYDAQGSVYGSPAVGSNGRVYFGDSLGYFHAINPAAYASGSGNPLVWRRQADSSFLSSPAIVNGSVIAATTRSVVYAYEDSVNGLDSTSVWPAFGRSNRRDAALPRNIPVTDVAVSLVGTNGNWNSSTTEVRFNVVIDNLGTLPLYDIAVELTYPYESIPTLALVSITNPAGACSPDGISCLVDALEAGARTTINVVMSQAAKQKAPYQVEVSLAEPETGIANNTARKEFGGSLGWFLLMAVFALVLAKYNRRRI